MWRTELFALLLATAVASAQSSSSSWRQHVIATDFRSNTASAGDFNGDGRLDVIANDAVQKRDVLFVAPNWTPTVIHSGADSIYSAALDLDRDGRLDFVGARYQPGLLYWLKQPSDKTARWTATVLDDAAKGGVDGIHGLAVADIDGDGTQDLVANSAQPKGPYANSLAWYKMPGGVRHIFAKGDAPGLSHYFGAGDVDGDGRTDVASAAKIADGGNWFAWWRQGREAAAAWEKRTIAQGHEGASNVLVTDVNGDGKPDFLASRGHGTGVLWFRAPNWSAVPIDDEISTPHSLAVGDMDGDGDVDAVACSAVYGGKPAKPLLRWYRNDGRGKFSIETISDSQASYHLSLADMDGDGDPDILIAGQESRNVVWYENRLPQKRSKR
ncbi:MAG TPA: VCBS repeat-containing protein [Bryobacteraceae bacterium]|nr:VCBS repeat-containing protein [Bryobacteraceae bacterium]